MRLHACMPRCCSLPHCRMGECACPTGVHARAPFFEITPPHAALSRHRPEGLATFVGYMSAPSTGVLVAIAIALHNIPGEQRALGARPCCHYC